MFIFALVGMIFGFLAMPYRIYKAHKSGDAEWGDYAFIGFLFLLIFQGILGYFLGWFDTI